MRNTAIFTFLDCIISLLLYQALCTRNENGCTHLPSKWMDIGGNFCYIVEEINVVPWIDAVYQCSQEGGTLASFHSTEEVERLITSVKKETAGLYIGLWKNNNGTFSWVDQTTFDFSNWSPGEPDFVDEKCVEMFAPSGKWSDVRCTTNLGYVCSVPKSQKPLLSQKVCPSNASKWEELHKDVCYIVERENKADWNDANSLCLEKGGSLATFHSIEEISAVIQSTKDYKEGLHIGLTQNDRYEWTDGSPLDLDFWNVREPNEPVKKCGEMNSQTGVWSDVWCGKRSGYICSYVKEVCGGGFFSASGTFSSPNYPNPYRSHENCTWKITVPQEFVVILEFQTFNIESGSLCQFDYVEIRDGLEPDSPVLGIYCGVGSPEPVRSSGNTMAISFITDESDERTGFLLTFKAGSPRYVFAQTALRELPDYFLARNVHDTKVKVGSMKLNIVKERGDHEPKIPFRAILKQISGRRNSSET